jgi:hypothetical protein
MPLEGLGKLKKTTSSGIRTGDIPACSIVPQPTAPTNVNNDNKAPYYIIFFLYPYFPCLQFQRKGRGATCRTILSRPAPFESLQTPQHFEPCYAGVFFVRRVRTHCELRNDNVATSMGTECSAKWYNTLELISRPHLYWKVTSNTTEMMAVLSNCVWCLYTCSFCSLPSTSPDVTLSLCFRVNCLFQFVVLLKLKQNIRNVFWSPDFRMLRRDVKMSSLAR